MKMKISRLLSLFLLSMMPLGCLADIILTATYIDKTGSEVVTTKNFDEEAPLHVRFSYSVDEKPDEAIIEWHIVNEKTGTSVVRYEEEPEYDFTEAGLTVITLNILLNDEIIDTGSIGITISESHLEMPNAFSPNDDGKNDKYGAKGVNDENATGRWKSIIDFHAYIFNRWGQKLYEWHDVNGYWDGTFNGSPVKDGVYFVVVKARGADGMEYDIRKDVNVIRNFNPETNGGENHE